MAAAKRMEIKDAIVLTFTVRAWGNRKKADPNKVDTKADKDLFNTTKQLIDKKGELKAIYSHLGLTKGWVVKNSLPSFLGEGTYIFNIKQVEEVEKVLADNSAELKSIVESLLNVYPQKIKDVESRLGAHFNRADYPTVKELRERFAFEWRWVEFNVPKSLPGDVYKAEKKKAEEMWQTAAEEITQALRESFRRLVAHAVEVLSIGEDGKTKKFKDASFDNINEFIELFRMKNLTNDTELASLVAKAKTIMVGVEDPQELKKDKAMRTTVEKQFKEITKTLDKLVESNPRRKFSFDD